MKLMKILFATALLSLGASPVTAAIIGLEETLDGGTLEVDVVISALDGEYVGGYDIDVLFDETILAIAGVEQFDAATGIGPLGDNNDLLYAPFYDDSFNGLGSCFTPGPGCVEIYGLSFLLNFELAAFQDGDRVVLATLIFDLINEGDFGLGLFLEAPFRDVKDGFGEIIELGEPGTEVPEPGTLALLGLGLLGVAASRRRKLGR